MSTEIELEPYREVIDIMAKRIKKTEHINSELQGVIITYQQRVESLQAALRRIVEVTRDDLAEDIALIALNSPSNDLQDDN
jgi:predicted RNase H-like nuclease (RuvC/YqgF family)